MTEGFSERAGKVFDAVDKLEPHTRSLAGGLQDDRRFPALWPPGRGIDEPLEWGCGNTGLQAATFGKNLVEGVERGRHAATGVGQSQFFEFRLNGAVFAVGAVQRQKDHLSARGDL